jgi:glycosyltransferase involved in cell wall biosynthesis
LSTIRLSYVIATRNRLTFLKITLPKLFAALQDDEEIVVVDGNSTDGAKQYLQKLFEEDKIQQFVSEPDHNQAHAWNKGFILAKGEIIKKIIDDDVHCYTAINKCKNYMLSNQQVDICISDCLAGSIANPSNIHVASRLKQYNDWKSGKTTCFTFTDVHMLVRKSTLSYVGLFDTQFAMIDWEYSLRCSFLKANIAYYTGYNSLSVSTPGNVSSQTNAARLKQEGLIGKTKYGYEGDRADISLFSEFKIAVGKAINYKAANNQAANDIPQLPAPGELIAIYHKLYEAVEDYNRRDDFIFIA